MRKDTQNISKLKTTAINCASLRHALNNLIIKLRLSGDVKPVVALAEAMLILNLNSVPSKEALLSYLRSQRASIIAKILKGLYEALYAWLTSSIDTTSKLNFKTQQTLKSGAKTLSRPSQDTDSDENSDSDQRAPSMTPRERVRRGMAAIGLTTAKRNEENDDYVLQRLANRGNKLRADHIEALIMCHTGRDEMIPMQRSAAEIIRQSVDAEFHNIFDVPYTNSSTVDMQGTIYLRALMIRLWDLNTAAITTQQQRIEEAILSYGTAEKDQLFDARR